MYGVHAPQPMTYGDMDLGSGGSGWHLQQTPIDAATAAYLPMSLTQHVQLQQQLHASKHTSMNLSSRPPDLPVSDESILLRSPRTARVPTRREGTGSKRTNGSQSARMASTRMHSAPSTMDSFLPSLGPFQSSGGFSSTLPFVSSPSVQQLNAQLQQNMVANASRANLAALLHTPMPPRVAIAMQPIAGVRQDADGRTAMMHSPPSDTGAAQATPAFASSGAQTQRVSPIGTVASLPPQLVLPPEFVALQAQKLLAQQAQEAAQPAPTTAGKANRPSTASLIRSMLLESPLVPPPPPTAPKRTAVVPATAKFVPSRVPDVGYENMKRRMNGIVSQLKKAASGASTDRAAKVQLEMRGSVRFDTSDPKAIFAAVRAQASKPIDADDVIFNQKHLVRLKDGTWTTVFGRIHERTDTVRDEAISQFFMSRKAADHGVSLDEYVNQNYAKDQTKYSAAAHAKSTKHNQDAQHFERKARVDRTDEELLECEDEVLTPLERWKRDQLRIKVAKLAAEETAAREQRAKQHELLRLRLERERFEREEREKAEREAAERAAKEEEERQWKDAERQRQYRELILLQSEETKHARAEQEAAKKHAEEEARRIAEEKRVAEEARKKRMGADYVPAFMKPIGAAAAPRVRTTEEDALVARVRVTEKDWQLARSKLRAEMVRVEELIRQRDPSAKHDCSAATIEDPYEFREVLRRLRTTPLVQAEEHRLKEMDRIEQEARGWFDKAVAAQEAGERDPSTRTEQTPTQRGTRRTNSVLPAGIHVPANRSVDIDAESLDGPHARSRRRTVRADLPQSTSSSKSPVKSAAAGARSISRAGSRVESRVASRVASRAGSRPDSRTSSRPPSPKLPPHARHASMDAATDGEGVQPVEAASGDPADAPISNERTKAIDASLAQLSSMQADFDARIKALTSFGPSTSPTSPKKPNVKKAASRVK